jgi:DNA-binding NarL/FixJ family response regulator
MVSVPSEDRVIALVPDMIFATKIRATAEALCVPISIVKSAVEVQRALAGGRIRLVLVDLNSSGAVAFEAIRLVRAGGGPVRLVAFVSHVDESLAHRAAEAGADEVLPRSRFSRELPDILGFRPRGNVGPGPTV